MRAAVPARWRWKNQSETTKVNRYGNSDKVRKRPGAFSWDNSRPVLSEAASEER